VPLDSEDVALELRRWRAGVADFSTWEDVIPFIPQLRSKDGRTFDLISLPSADLKVKNCSRDGSNRHKHNADPRSMSTREASHVRLAHLGGLPLAQPQPSFELHNIAASYATLSTQYTHDCPPRTTHQTPKSTHLLTSPLPRKREQQLRFMSASIENLKSFGMFDRISPLRQVQTDHSPPRLACLDVLHCHSQHM
jgi:hypothetical protein